MPERIRFHLDENVDPAIAFALRRAGIDVTTSQQINLLAESDTVQLDFARTQARILVTHDDDFLIFNSQRTDHSRIAYCQKNVKSIGYIVRMLMLLYEVATLEEMKGRVEYL
ncbi:DUF5615 family PIN-like protein [Nostoc sp. LPT]|uniref:DUF5615 family PIN-like protein n=1 Tax=Nostoc sp. LPT TaxID=2815387 RepID=UPI001D5C31A3|nr:DUF5615 family PIN-like protein [Nostoc sp. LPT]MBN4004718.1 DUF5615 family PIN-like protein [Nostoc sp. LPT]